MFGRSTRRSILSRLGYVVCTTLCLVWVLVYAFVIHCLLNLERHFTCKM